MEFVPDTHSDFGYSQHLIHALTDKIAVFLLLAGKIQQNLFALRFCKFLGVRLEKIGRSTIQIQCQLS